MLNFEAIKKQKIIVVGDVMLDAYYFGRVDRLSPEAPVPVVEFQRAEYRLGGAANVALNLASLGAVPLLFGVTGNDDEGSKFNDALAQNKIEGSFLVAEDSRPTTVKTRVIGSHHQLLRIDKETTKGISDVTRSKILEGIRNVIHEAKALIFEDYDKGMLDDVLIKDIIAICKSHQLPVIVDPKRRNFFSYSHATLFKPNLKEIREGLKLDSCDTMAEIEQAAQSLLKQMQLTYVMVTLSERGILICSEKETQHFPAHIRAIADVSGAGDTVVSVAALCLAQGLDAAQTARYSNLAGGMVCEALGVVPLNKERFKEESKQLTLV